MQALRAARPTAVNLAWAVDRVWAAAQAGGAEAARAEAERDPRRGGRRRRRRSPPTAPTCSRARGGSSPTATPARSPTGGDGLRAGASSASSRPRGEVEVLASETRPLLQGARLTVWELARDGIPVTLAVDGAAAGLMRRGEVDAVIVGCDRVAANGDVANKVGTYAHALAARAAGIPFVVAGPTSSIDPVARERRRRSRSRSATPTRSAGPAASWSRCPTCRSATPPSTSRRPSWSRAFVSERGVAQPPTAAAIAALLASA